jgi:hypothetical protein
MGAPKGNKFALGNTGGRPPKFENTEALKTAIQGYFDYCLAEKEKVTITGLTLFIGFESRSSLDDYCNRNKEYSYIIKRAKLAVENSYEMHGETIDVFALKNMGWSDRLNLDLKDDRLILDGESREARIEELKKKLNIDGE